MEKKSFPIAGVLGVATGILLETNGFSAIHEVMDHFYPGIMTIGCAAMAGHAKEHVLKQHPKLREVIATGPSPTDCAAFLQHARICVGDSLELEGPIQVIAEKQVTITEGEGLNN